VTKKEFLLQKKQRKYREVRKRPGGGRDEKVVFEWGKEVLAERVGGKHDHRGQVSPKKWGITGATCANH